jgi:glutamine amidotransferase
VCRLLAVVSPDGRGIERTIGTRRAAAFVAQSREHGDGWGTAWLDGPAGDQVHRHREVAPATGRGTAEAMRRRTVAAILHLRMATPGLAVGLENTHPFHDAGPAFAHNGAIMDRDRLRELVGNRSTGAAVTGATDSELYFALFRDRLAVTGDPTDAMVGTVELLRSEFPTASLNAMALTARQLVVVQSAERAPVPMLPAGPHGGRGRAGDDDYFRIYQRIRPDGSVAFASSGPTARGWAPLPEATVVTVDLTPPSRALVSHRSL